jgi:hypothetical protein
MPLFGSLTAAFGLERFTGALEDFFATRLVVFFGAPLVPIFFLAAFFGGFFAPDFLAAFFAFLAITYPFIELLESNGIKPSFGF